MKQCDECASNFDGAVSPMRGLCPECSHLLYEYPNCDHVFVEGSCSVCFWDGSRSDFTRRLIEQEEKAKPLREADGTIWRGQLGQTDEKA